MPITALAPLLLLAGADTAPAGTRTAEEAMRRYRTQFRPVAEIDCPRDAGDIVVCGRRGADPNRPPIPFPRAEGETVRLLPGEPPSAAAALRPMCTWDCVEPPRGGIRNIVKGLNHLLGKDD